MNVEHFKWTNEERVNEVADWLADYRMEGELWVLGALEGLVIGLALATRHPEYLHALVQAICASEDYDLEELPDGHSWLEHQEMTDLLVAENPWENEETGC